MNIIEIRKANITDGKMVSGIIRESFIRQAKSLCITEVEYPNYVAFETEEMAKTRIIDTEVKLLFVNASPIGTIGSHVKGEVGYIERLAVLPGYRGNDYGSLLLEQTETELFNRGCSIINISIVASFLRLKQYYEELGYTYQRTDVFPSLPFEVSFLSKLKGELNFS